MPVCVPVPCVAATCTWKLAGWPKLVDDGVAPRVIVGLSLTTVKLTVVVEEPRFSADYLDPSKRSIGNSVQVEFRGGEWTEKVTVEYPIGHRRRRAEGMPLLLAKFEENLRSRFPPPAVSRVLELCADQERLERTPVSNFVALFVPETGDQRT